VAQGRYILALNPDTLVLGSTLAQLVQQMDANPAIGAATTIQYTADKQVLTNASRQVTYGYLLFQYTFLGKLLPGRLQAYRDWLWYPDWDRTSEREVGVMPGSCIIAARETWQAAGGFSERLLMYFTEDQLSGAVQQLGKRTMYLVTDGIVHYEGASTFDRVTRSRTGRSLNLYFRDLLAYTGLVYGRPAQALLAIMILPTWIVQRIKAR
jgi:GT2 family glycosyltransferase